MDELAERSSLISTHALTRSATVAASLAVAAVVISIQALTWSATKTKMPVTESGQEFQSTHSHGVRHSSTACTCILGDFNPRTHMECDE